MTFWNKWLWTFFLLVWPLALPAQENTEEVDPYGPWMICDVAVDGLKNISKRTVTKAAHSKKGELYERYTVNEDILDISSLGNFDSVQVDISRSKGSRQDELGQDYPCHRITYIVEEKPIFDRITYQGRKKLGKSAITGAMTLKLKDPFNEGKLMGDMERIKAKYAEKGYISAQVNYEVIPDEKTNTVTVHLIIDEGPRVKVAALNLNGLSDNATLPAEKIIKKASNRTGKVFKPQNLQRDWVKMVLYGRNEGFSEFNLSEPKIDVNQEQTEVTLSYNVTEGEKVNFGTVSFEGNNVFTPEELKEHVYIREGKLYNQKDFDDTVIAIQQQYANKGYLQVRVEPQKTIENGELNIN